MRCLKNDNLDAGPQGGQGMAGGVTAIQGSFEGRFGEGLGRFRQQGAKPPRPGIARRPGG
jgi:hypothetical protein